MKTPTLNKATRVAIAAVETRLGKRLFDLVDQVQDLQGEVRMLKSKKLRDSDTDEDEMLYNVLSKLRNYKGLLDKVPGYTAEGNEVDEVIEEFDAWRGQE